MIRARRATLRPSPEQAAAFGRACGAARTAWNWGLGRKIEARKIRQAALDAGTPKETAPKVPTAIDLHRGRNKLKKMPVEDGGFPWMYAVSKCAPQEALRDLDLAFAKFFGRLKIGEKPGFPRFKAKGRDPGHFRRTGSITVKDGRIHLPRVGAARKRRAADKRIGARKKGERRIESKRLQRARKVAARRAHRVANIRKDALHRATTRIAQTYSVVVVEDLHGKNRTRRAKGRGRAAKAGLNRVTLDGGMLRPRPLLAYEMPRHGGRLDIVPAPTTSRRCSRCGALNNPGSSKTYKCAACGLVLDRDENASLDILAAASCTAAPPDFGPGARRGAAARPKATAGRRAATIRRSDGGVG